jgi:hypothetical protein
MDTPTQTEKKKKNFFYFYPTDLINATRTCAQSEGPNEFGGTNRGGRDVGEFF